MKYEIWKDVKGFEEKYEISSYGRLRNKKTNRILKMTNQYGNYFSVILYDENHKKSTKMHRLVAETFIPNPNNYLYVNHKDLNKQNNRVDNLEWCTQSENVKHALNNGVNIMKGFNNYNKNKFRNKYGFLSQYDKEHNLIATYTSLAEAYLKTGVCKRDILYVINGKRKTAGGYIWKCSKEVV